MAFDIMQTSTVARNLMLGAYQADLNWTRGCIAVSNQERDEIRELVPDGTPVRITP